MHTFIVLFHEKNTAFSFCTSNDIEGTFEHSASPDSVSYYCADNAICICEGTQRLLHWTNSCLVCHFNLRGKCLQIASHPSASPLRKINYVFLFLMEYDFTCWNMISQGAVLEYKTNLSIQNQCRVSGSQKEREGPKECSRENSGLLLFMYTSDGHITGPRCKLTRSMNVRLLEPLSFLFQRAAWYWQHWACWGWVAMAREACESGSAAALEVWLTGLVAV